MPTVIVCFNNHLHSFDSGIYDNTRQNNLHMKNLTFIHLTVKSLPKINEIQLITQKTNAFVIGISGSYNFFQSKQ